MESPLRDIPQIAKIINTYKSEYPEEIIKKAAREVTQRYREKAIKGLPIDLDSLYRDVEKLIKELLGTKLKKVINATGVVINTNLGRAPLHEEVVKFIAEVASGYSNLEYELASGSRGSRNAHLEEYLRELTGADSAFVVNNNAGAVYLVLNTIAREREVILSRGELVEIGGSFRIPDIMTSSGARLVEVGTTNKTKLVDYEAHISENTALLMKVHRSNFHMEGFTEEVSLKDLALLGDRKGIPTYYDAGSGLLIDLNKLGIKSDELTFREAINSGINIVSGSGDKLLGGPQAGIIVGEKTFVEKIKKNPMARALRIDKLTLSALEYTLKLYLEGRKQEIPVIAMLTQSLQRLRRRAQNLKRLIRKDYIELEILKDVAKPGGGSLPRLELPTYCVALGHKNLTPDELSRKLRSSTPPVVARIKRERVLLDMRTLSDREIPLLARVLNEL